MDLEFILKILSGLLPLVILILVYVSKKEFTKARGYAVSFIVEAERIYAYGDNAAKFNYVVRWVYNCLPGWFRSVVPITVLGKTIQTVFNQIKVALDYIPKNIDKGGA